MEMAPTFSRSEFNGCAGFMGCDKISKRETQPDSGFQKGSNGYGEIKVEVRVDMKTYCWRWSTVSQFIVVRNMT